MIHESWKIYLKELLVEISTRLVSLNAWTALSTNLFLANRPGLLFWPVLHSGHFHSLRPSQTWTRHFWQKLWPHWSVSLTGVAKKSEFWFINRNGFKIELTKTDRTCQIFFVHYFQIKNLKNFFLFEEVLLNFFLNCFYLDFETILMTIHKMTMYNNYDHA